MSYGPKHQEQLGRGVPVPGRTQGSRDCGPRAVQMGIDWALRGDTVPTVTTIRRRMGKTGPVPTNVYDAKAAADGFYRRGRKPVRYYIKSRIADVRSAVGAGKYVHCCIDYGRFNAVSNGTGDPNFKGGHSVGVLGQRHYRGKAQWLLWDPLDDHRRASIKKGPRWVDREDIVRAMEAFAGGAGRCYAGVFGGGQKR